MKKNSIIISGIYALISIVLCNIPLFNYLGYEFSFFIAVVSIPLGGIFAISYLKKKFIQGMQKENFFLILKKIFYSNIAFLLIPFIIITVNAFFVKNCSYTYGVFYFILLPIIGVIFSTSFAVYLFFNVKRKKKFFYLLFCFIIIFLLALPFYFTPQSYLYNPFFGYLNSMIYDEELTISSSLILYRVNTLLESVILLYISISTGLDYKPNRNILEKLAGIKDVFLRYKFLFFLSGLVLLFWLLRNEIHIINSNDYIAEQIGSKYSTKHFDIYYSSKYYNSDDIKEVAKIHEFYFEEISKQLNIDFPHRIESFIYATPEQKQELTGAKYTDFAKPWLYQTHINTGDEKSVLKHEMVHVMAGYFGLPVFNISLRQGLVEGISMAIDRDRSNRSLDEFAALLIKTGFYVNIEDILNVKGFMSQNSSYSYILSGAFSRFIISKYGIEKYKSVYSGSGFEKVYSKNIGELNKEWNEYLKTVSINPNDTTLMKFLFGRKSIFQKTCPRIIANLNNEARNENFNKNYDKARELFQKSLALTFSNESAQGLIHAYFQLQKYDSVLKITKNILEDEKHKYSGIPFRLQRGDAFWFKAVKEKNNSFIDSALYNYTILRNLGISEQYDLILSCRMASLQDSTVSEKMLDYFILKKDDFLRAVILKDLINKDPDFIAGKILLSETLLNKKEYYESINYLRSISEKPTDDFFRKEKYRFMGMNLFYLKNYPDAINNFISARKLENSPARQDRIDEWIDKCRCFAGIK